MLALGVMIVVQLAPSQCLIIIWSPGPLSKRDPTAHTSVVAIAATPLRRSGAPHGLAGLPTTSPSGPKVGVVLSTVTGSLRMLLRGVTPVFARFSTICAVTV